MPKVVSPKKQKTTPSVTPDTLRKLGLEKENPGAFCGEWLGSGKVLESISPIDGQVLAAVRSATPEEYERVVQHAKEAFEQWQVIPAPKRGEVIRQLGNALREAKSDLGRLVTLEAGKITAEGEGEVQEMIDICDFAVGLSRQLYGLTIASERPQHRMMEQWMPLGVVGIITAFNFPVAVWAWNSALAGVCGDSTIWKPSSETPLTAIATIKIAERVCRANQIDPAIFSLVIGDGATIGERLINDSRIPLISATGSTKMGRHVGEVRPRIVLRGVPTGAARVRTRARQVLGVPDEAQPGVHELAGQVGPVAEAHRAVVVGDALGGAGEQREVVGLARVCHRVRVGEHQRVRHEVVQPRRLPGLGDLPVRLVLEDHHDDVRGRAGARRPRPRRRRRGDRGRGGRAGRGGKLPRRPLIPLEVASRHGPSSRRTAAARSRLLRRCRGRRCPSPCRAICRTIATAAPGSAADRRIHNRAR